MTERMRAHMGAWVAKRLHAMHDGIGDVRQGVRADERMPERTGARDGHFCLRDGSVAGVSVHE